MAVATETDWTGCYDDSWQGLIVDESFAHPAKYARGLIERIADYLDLPRGSVVVDPFGGVALGGIVFASRGVRWLGVELEQKFVDLGKQNIEKHRRLWEASGDPLPVIVQGDSRRLREVLAGVGADCVVSSPPFQESLSGKGACQELRPDGSSFGQGKSIDLAEYGSTPGQLGGMPAGSVDGVVSSPPFCESVGGGGNQLNQLQNLHYAANKNAYLGTRKGQPKDKDYGATPGQLGAMPSGSVEAIVSSPPYEDPSHGRHDKDGQWDQVGGIRKHCRGEGDFSEGNMYHQTGETFWSAAREIVSECWHILRPGGRAVWVCKDFIRKGQRVPFSDDWRRLCESVGFELVEWIQASLVKEHSHPSLFDEDPVVKRVSRKSFFRRLCEAKGSPPIDHEDVLVMRKP